MSSTIITCVVCGSSGSSKKNFVPVFGDECSESEQQKIALLVEKLTKKEIKWEPEQEQMVCTKKCVTLINEYGELLSRLDEIKSEILDQNNPEDDTFADQDEPASVGVSESKFTLSNKLLFLPPTDEENVQLSTVKTSRKDIEMKLIEIDGDILVGEVEQEDESMDMEESTNDMEEMMNDMEDSADEDDTLDAGAVENSSDSDYSPPKKISISVPVKSSPGTENSIEFVKIKTEPKTEPKTSSSGNTKVHMIPMIPMDKKPLILRRKQVSEEVETTVEEDNKADISPMPIVSKEGNLFTCLLCQGDEVAVGEAKAITEHVKRNHGFRLYICDVCGQDFLKRNLLSAHLDEHVAAEEGDFQCEICNRIFSNLRLFRVHRRMHYPQNKAWECETCGKKYSSKNLLDEHINTHLGVRPYVCGICGKDFASKYTYKAHEKTHESRPRPFKCEQCNKSFLSQQNLTQHQRTHLGMKEFSCHLCKKQFGSAHNLEVHSIVHTGYKPFICTICSKAFARKAEIRDHERTHTGERPYQCEHCGATFSQRSNLQSHKRATHYDDKRYQCNLCGKGFKRRRLLDYHIKAAHTGERPFKCEVCDATFVYPEHFKKHRRIHTGEKPFLCEVCGKAFNSRDNRNAHRFVHSDKKPYECLVCGAGFMRKPLLYQHMQSQGHLNDTIVVNQPRLTTDDDQVVTVNSQGEMEIIGGDTTESQLYVQDEDSEHIIIDGQQISFAEVASDDDQGEVVEEVEQVAEGQETFDYSEIFTSDILDGSETQIIETSEGPIQLVKVRIPNENGEEEEAWVKILSE
ncbi:uncharacterized protein [Leptinotarsa decemlineata]|uniref:uncharacterized protein n=1 Tax=Leptinotarsa decemlineata TaxID=7539 RepID=UPI003D3089EC